MFKANIEPLYDEAYAERIAKTVHMQMLSLQTHLPGGIDHNLLYQWAVQIVSSTLIESSIDNLELTDD